MSVPPNYNLHLIRLYFHFEPFIYIHMILIRHYFTFAFYFGFYITFT